MVVSIFTVVSAVGFILLGLGLIRLSLKICTDIFTGNERENKDHFYLHNPRPTKISNLIIVVLCAVCLAVLISLCIEIPSPDMVFVAEAFTPVIFVAPFVLWRALMRLHRVFLEVEVTGDEISYKTLFRKSSFYFYDIEDAVQTLHINEWALRFVVFGKKYVLHDNLINYGFLITRLRECNIPIEDKYVCEYKAEFHDPAGVLPLFIQVVLGAISIVLVFRANYSDEVFLYDAYTAVEVLTAYLIWYRIILWSSAIAVIIVLLGNWLIVASQKDSGRVWRNITVMICSIVIIGLFVGVLNFDTVEPPNHTLVRWAWEDLEAIEQNQLYSVVRTIDITTSHESPRTLPGILSSRHPYRLYRMWIPDEPHIFYPHALAPALIRERLAQDEYRISHNQEYVRMYEVRFTPNFRVVVEVIPRRVGD